MVRALFGAAKGLGLAVVVLGKKTELPPGLIDEVTVLLCRARWQALECRFGKSGLESRTSHSRIFDCPFATLSLTAYPTCKLA